MCGVIGFIGKTNKSTLDIGTIANAAIKTEAARGGHAFGWAWIDTRGVLRSYKQPGKLANHMRALDMLNGAVAMIGHFRWATHGSVVMNENNHPHPVDGGWLVHNGVLREYQSLSRGYMGLNSRCDSEMLARLVEDSRGATPGVRVKNAIDNAVGGCDSPLAILALWKPGSLVAARRGNPLAWVTHAEGIYLASLKEHLCGRAEDVPDETVVTIRYGREASVIKTSRRRNRKAFNTPTGSAVSTAIKASQTTSTGSANCDADECRELFDDPYDNWPKREKSTSQQVEEARRQLANATKKKLLFPGSELVIRKNMNN